MRKCLEHDEEQWKLNKGKVISNQQDYTELRKVIQQYFHIIKEVFLITAARGDQFPCIGLFGTEEFSKHIGLIDEKKVKKEDVNRNFIAANVSGEEELKQNPQNELIRYEFIEFMARMANEKYKRYGLVQTWTDAFKMMIE